MLKHARRSMLVTAVIVGLALTCPPATQARGDFVLWGYEQLTVATAHDNGWLYVWSRAVIVSGGSVSNLYAHDSTAVDISSGSVGSLYAYNGTAVDISSGSVGSLYAYNSTAVDISSGSVGSLNAYSSTAVDISSGSVGSLNAYNSTAVDISSGSVGSLYAYNGTAVDICGGSVSNRLQAYNSTAVDMSGGSVSELHAYHSSALTFHARDFHLGAGLSLDGDRVLGTGDLSGEWFDGTRWVVEIAANTGGATILAIPEPATLSLLVLGGLAVIRRRGPQARIRR